jgi:tetratricopeptide (TPR) repeat protein
MKKTVLHGFGKSPRCPASGPLGILDTQGDGLMKPFMVRVSVLAVLGLCLAVVGYTQDYGGMGQQQALLQSNPTPAPANAAQAGPKVTKAEDDAYKQVVKEYSAHSADPKQFITLAEGFISKYPTSIYAGGIYSELTTAYLNANQTDKMLDAGEKALAANPNNVDVLPVLAWAIARRVNSTAPDFRQQMEKATNYAKRGITLLSTMAKPGNIDDAAFTKVKNAKLSQCRSGLGTAYVKTGHYDEAIPELTQAVALDETPDPVDYYLLGIADQAGSHFTDAIAAFTKCAAGGPMQAQCKNLADETKSKAANSLEAPK